MACKTNWNNLPNELIVNILSYNTDPKFRETGSRTNALFLSFIYPGILRGLFNELDQHPLRDSAIDNRIYALLSPTPEGGAQTTDDFAQQPSNKAPGDYDSEAKVTEEGFYERLSDPGFVASRIQAVFQELTYRSEEISDPKVRTECQEAIKGLRCSVALQAMRHFENQSLIAFVGVLSDQLGNDFKERVTAIRNDAANQEDGTEQLAHAFRQLLREFQPRLDSIQYLNLSNCGLTSVPPEIGMLKNLVILDLNWNKLSCLPHEIGELKKLEKLSLSNNQISEIPSEIGRITQLKELYLNSNKLEMIPPGMLLLKGMEILSISSNRIFELPEAIAKLKMLKKFYAADNKISAFPRSFGSLLGLQLVDMSNNRIKGLPNSFKNLKNLRVLF